MPFESRYESKCMPVQTRLVLAEGFSIERTVPDLAPLSVFVLVRREVKSPACNFPCRCGDTNSVYVSHASRTGTTYLWLSK